MKSIIKVLLVLGVFASLPFAVCGQSNHMTPAEYNALVQRLEATTPLPASEAPKFGNFYTIQHGEAWPPLPGNTMALPFWSLGGGVYLLDDEDVNYTAIQSASTSRFRMDDDFETDFQPQVYSPTNLYLTNMAVTNGVASMVIHEPVGTTNTATYDLLYCNGPTSPWRWVLHTQPGQTNLSVTNATDAMGFYGLGVPDSSQGTDFWVAFVGVSSPLIFAPSISISSPVAVSNVTVSIPNQLDGSILVASNCSNPSVNGTYNLTSVLINPNNYANLFGDTVTSAYVNGPYQVFFDAQEYAWELVDSTSVPPLLLFTGDAPDNTGMNMTGVIWTDNPYNTNTPSPPDTYCPLVPLTESFSLAAGTAINLPVPTNILVPTNDLVENTNIGINITATAPVSVYVLADAIDNIGTQASAAYTAYPTTLLGTNYLLLGRPSNLDGAGSDFAIVATANDTMVRITPSAAADLAGYPGRYTNYMNAGDTYQICSSNGTGDVTGTVITSDKPIAVFAGAISAYVPDTNTQFANPLVQEQMPVEDWGTNALALSFAGRTNGDTYRILAASNNTVITITGLVLTSTNENVGPPWTVTTSYETNVVTESAGQFYDIGVDGPVQFQATKPIQVAQFANGDYFDNPPNNYGDPCEILLPPTGHYLETNVVYSIPYVANAANFVENYVNIIVPQSAITNTFVDNNLVTNLIPAANFVEIGSSGYYGAQITNLASGVAHTVTSSQPVGVEVYGWAYYDSYGYFGGIVK